MRVHMPKAFEPAFDRDRPFRWIVKASQTVVRLRARAADRKDGHDDHQKTRSHGNPSYLHQPFLVHATESGTAFGPGGQGFAKVIEPPHPLILRPSYFSDVSDLMQLTVARWSSCHDQVIADLEC